jgi:hypothetical protein
MLVGEAQGLSSERATAFDAARLKKVYTFQVCCDDGLDHFRGASLSHPSLRFVLVYGYDDHSYGSHFIAGGRVRSYSASGRLVEKVMARHGVGEIPDGEWPFEAEINAESELMNLAEARGHKSLLRVGKP